MFSWGGEGGQCLSAPPLLPIYSAAFRSSGLDVDMVADKEVDRWPTSTWWLTIKKTLTLTLTWKSNLVSEFVHGGWLIGPKLYPKLTQLAHLLCKLNFLSRSGFSIPLPHIV